MLPHKFPYFFIIVYWHKVQFSKAKVAVNCAAYVLETDLLESSRLEVPEMEQKRYIHASCILVCLPFFKYINV